MKKKKTRSPKRAQRDPVIELYYARKQPRGAIVLMKEERTYAEVKALLPKLGTLSMHPDLRLALIGNIGPNNWNDVMVTPVLPPSRNWIQELGWLAHGFQAAAEKLNSFFLNRKKFGRYYLLGEYEAAKAILDEIKTEHGLSLWIAEREFMLLQAATGFEAHKRRLSEIQSELTNALVGYLVTTSSSRLEPHVTPEAFHRTTEENLRELRRDGHEIFASWIELHIAPWSFDWLKNRAEILHQCWGKALVDRYDRVIKILSCLPFEDISSQDRKLLCTIIGDLDERIDDRQLKRLLEILGANKSSLDPKTEEYLCALDRFVTAEYEECRQKVKKLILEDPTCFEFYWLFAKTDSCCSESVADQLPEHSVARTIINHLSQIAANKVAINIPLREIDSIALKIGDNHLGLSLRQFVKYEESGSYDPEAIAQMSIQNKIDVYSSLESQGSPTALSIKGSAISNYSNHLCMRLEGYATGKTQDPHICDLVSPAFASLVRAKRFAWEGEHQEVLAQIKSILEKSSESSDVKLHGVVAARLQFDALISLDNAGDAAQAITTQYLSNPNNLRHVPFERLVEGCVSGRWPTLRKLACWPILVALNNGSEQDVYESVDDLLFEHNCHSPLSIANGEIPCSDDEMRIILRDVLVPQVISRGALWNRTAEERRRMRMQILQKLYSISIVDQPLVLEELSRLEQAQLLEAAYRDIEGPKFELDYSIINRELAKIFEGTFARYAEYRNYEAKGGSLTPEVELLSSAREGTEMKLFAAEKRTETSELLLRQITRAAFIQYLLDTTSGINAFLGTRIRHGSLENQLTRILGAHALLALKNSAGDYVCDPFVQKQLGDLEPDVRAAATDAYVAFTHTINSLISYLVNDTLRIRIPESILTFWERQGINMSEVRSDKGLLDFNRLFSEDIDLRFVGKEFSSVAALLTESERNFVIEANSAFNLVRKHLEQKVSQEMLAALHQLDDSISSIVPEGNCRVALRTKILAAKGEFAEDLTIISKWFSAAKPAAVELGLAAVEFLVQAE